MPSFEQLSALPRWMQVAFAARCARRAQRLETLTEQPSLACTELNDILRFAETHATGRCIASATPSDPPATPLFALDSDWQRRLREVVTTLGGWMKIYQTLGVLETCLASAKHAANAAIHAAQNHPGACSHSAWQAVDMAMLAAFVLREYWADRGDPVGEELYDTVLEDLSHDFRLLARYARIRHLTDDSFVPERFFLREPKSMTVSAPHHP